MDTSSKSPHHAQRHARSMPHASNKCSLDGAVIAMDASSKPACIMQRQRQGGALDDCRRPAPAPRAVCTISPVSGVERRCAASESDTRTRIGASFRYATRLRVCAYLCTCREHVHMLAACVVCIRVQACACVQR